MKSAAKTATLQVVKKGEGAGNSVSCRMWAEPTNPAPQRFSASTASTVGARCATFEQKYGFFDTLSLSAVAGRLFFFRLQCTYVYDMISVIIVE